jgi:transposase
MPRALTIRLDYTANDLRRLAAKTKDGAQATRLLALAAVAEGLSRGEAARIGGMKPQTLRLWVQRFNDSGPEGLHNRKSTGRPPKLTSQQKKELGVIVAAGPTPNSEGMTRWRLADLVLVIKERFGVEHDEVSVRRILKELGFSYSGSPRVAAAGAPGGWHASSAPAAGERSASAKPAGARSSKKTEAIDAV